MTRAILPTVARLVKPKPRLPNSAVGWLGGSYSILGSWDVKMVYTDGIPCEGSLTGA